MSALQDLIKNIRTEDTSIYLQIINHANENKLESYNVSQYIEKLPQVTTDKLTTNQVKLLKSIGFRGGRTCYFYGHNGGYFSKKFERISGNWRMMNDVDSLPEDDLMFLSDYHRTKWRKKNSTRKIKRKDLNFNMDMFSLTIFKKHITKGFSRTEAKRYVMAVNKAYNSSKKTAADMKIRNKFYYVILNNTETHTKALVNEMQVTRLIIHGTNNTMSYYNLDDDEAVSINIREYTRNLMSYAPVDSQHSYADDTSIATHSHGLETMRDNNRILSTASILLTIYDSNKNEAYKAIATGLVASASKESKKEMMHKTAAIQLLRDVV